MPRKISIDSILKTAFPNKSDSSSYGISMNLQNKNDIRQKALLNGEPLLFFEFYKLEVHVFLATKQLFCLAKIHQCRVHRFEHLLKIRWHNVDKHRRLRTTQKHRDQYVAASPYYA